MPKYIDFDALGVGMCNPDVFENKGYAEGWNSLIKILHDAPAADVEPVRHGRWVKMTGMMPPEFTGHYQCSECGWFCKKHSIKETDFDFCPGCGADMRKREKDAE